MSQKLKPEFQMLNEFADSYQSRYGNKPRINRVKMQWDMKRLIEDFGQETVSKVIEFYFVVDRPRHDLYDFYGKFDKLLDTMERHESDAATRAKRRKRTEELIRERQQWHTNKN